MKFSSLLVFNLAMFALISLNGTTVNAQSDTGSAVRSEREAELTTRNDERRPDDQWTYSLFGAPLTVGGQLGLRSNYDYESTAFDNDYKSQLNRYEVQLELLYNHFEKFYSFMEARIGYRENTARSPFNDARDQHTFRVGEMWLYFPEPASLPFDLQIGRQRFQDRREWWWDEDLDAIRLLYDGDGLSGEIAIARPVIEIPEFRDIDPEDDAIVRLLAEVEWQWKRRQHLNGFFLSHRDHSDRPVPGHTVDRSEEDRLDGNLRWAGFAADGRIDADEFGQFYYFTNFAWVSGVELVHDYDNDPNDLRVYDWTRRLSVSGWGLDTALTWRPRNHRSLSLTLGYATTSADSDPDDNVDRSFRQTGLQDNNHSYRGVDRFRFYGELLRPELSNLSILSLSSGLRFWQNSSIEVLYHNYRQVNAADSLRRDAIRDRPNGLSRDIGRELDIVVGIEEWTRLDIELVAASFQYGKSFGLRHNELAHSFSVTFNFNF